MINRLERFFAKKRGREVSRKSCSRKLVEEWKQDFDNFPQESERKVRVAATEIFELVVSAKNVCQKHNITLFVMLPTHTQDFGFGLSQLLHMFNKI